MIRRWDDDAGRPRSLWLDLGDGSFLAVERAGASGPRRADGAPGHHCLALRVEAAERAGWVARLTEAGVAVERETGYTLYFRDPEGNLVALSHWPEAAGRAYRRPVTTTRVLVRASTVTLPRPRGPPGPSAPGWRRLA